MNHTPEFDPKAALSRRNLIKGAMVGAGALLSANLSAQPGATRAAANGQTLVFTNATLVTADPVRTEYRHNGALAVQGDRIAAIGTTEDILRQFPRAEVFNADGKAILPGLMNCHAHLGATLEKGFNEDFGFPNSANLAISPGSLLSAEEATLMSVVAALESIRCGATTVVQNVSGIAQDAEQLAATGLRWVFAESIRDRENGRGPMSPPRLAESTPPVFSAALRDEGLQRVADLHSRWHGADNGRISVFPAVAFPEDTSPEILVAVREFAEQHDLNYTIHLNQSIAEVEFCQRYYGLRPTMYLERHGFLGPRLFAAHCRYVDEQEIAALGRTRTTVTHQAAMAANRGVIPPISALRAAGCTIALGTDNNNNDILEVMRIALLTERVSRNDAIPGTLPQPEDMLEDCTRGGAVAVGQTQTLGSLEVGKKADLIVLDMRKPHLMPHGRFLSVWIHNGQPSDVESVMVDGRFIMRDRRILTVDEGDIMAEAERVGRRVWDRVLDAGPVTVPRW